MVVLSDPMSILEIVGRVEHIKSPLSIICINGKNLIKNNGVIIDKIASSYQVPLVLGTSEYKPYTTNDLKESNFFFLANNKQYFEGCRNLEHGGVLLYFIHWMLN